MPDACGPPRRPRPCRAGAGRRGASCGDVHRRRRRRASDAGHGRRRSRDRGRGLRCGRRSSRRTRLDGGAHDQPADGTYVYRGDAAADRKTSRSPAPTSRRRSTPRSGERRRAAAALRGARRRDPAALPGGAHQRRGRARVGHTCDGRRRPPDQGHHHRQRRRRRARRGCDGSSPFRRGSSPTNRRSSRTRAAARSRPQTATCSISTDRSSPGTRAIHSASAARSRSAAPGPAARMRSGLRPRIQHGGRRRRDLDDGRCRLARDRGIQLALQPCPADRIRRRRDLELQSRRGHPGLRLRQQ